MCNIAVSLFDTYTNINKMADTKKSMQESFKHTQASLNMLKDMLGASDEKNASLLIRKGIKMLYDQFKKEGLLPHSN